MKFPQESSLSTSLARLLLKAQSELGGIIGELPPAFRGEGLAESLESLLNLQLGTTAVSLRLNPDNNAGLQLQATQGVQNYILTVGATAPGQPWTASATLTNTATGEVTKLDHADLLKGAVPEQFSALHKEVVSYVKRWVPESLWGELVDALKPGFRADTRSNTASGAAAAASARPGSDGESNTSAAEARAVAEAEALGGHAAGTGAGIRGMARFALPPEGASGAGLSGDVRATSPNGAADDADDWVTVVMSRRGEPDVRFTGKLLDGVASIPFQARYHELRVYQTKAGRYVGVSIGRSMRLNEVDRIEYKDVDQLQDLAEFFGHGFLAKALTARLGIQSFVEIA